MTRAGMIAAAEHAEKLRSFASLDEARTSLLAERDDALRSLARAAPGSPFTADYTPESLKSLERWYFELHDRDFAGSPISLASMGHAIAMYFGEVLVRHAGFAWVVEEFPFEPGKFAIGVALPLRKVMLSSYADLSARPSNKRRDLLWRDYRRHAV